jgi:hypothetical protein
MKDRKNQPRRIIINRRKKKRRERVTWAVSKEHPTQEAGDYRVYIFTCSKNKRLNKKQFTVPFPDYGLLLIGHDYCRLHNS